MNSYKYIFQNIYNFMVTRLRTGWPRNSGLIPHMSNRCFSSWNHPHWPWSSPRLLFNGC